MNANAMPHKSDRQPRLMNGFELSDDCIETPVNFENLAAQFGLQAKALAARLHSSCAFL